MKPDQELVFLGKRLVCLGKSFVLTLIFGCHVIVQACILFYTCWLSVFILLLAVLEKMTKRVEYKEPASLSIL